MNDTGAEPVTGHLSLRLYAALLAVGALALAAGGARLVLLGGSPYYLIAGAVFLAAGVLLWREDRRGAQVYGAMLAVTLAWALWESGLDPWALLPRVIVPGLFGLFLLLPRTRRLLGQRPLAWRWWGLGAALSLFFLGYAIHASGPESPLGAPSALRAATLQTDWLEWGGNQRGTRYADVEQLTPHNVGQLELAWTFETGAAPRPGGATTLAFEAPPLKIGDTLYLCSPHNVVFALDAVTGKERWRFDPQADDRGLVFTNCRGISHAVIPGAAPDRACASRLYMGTVDARLLAIDAKTGRPCADFGHGGAIDLRTGLAPHPKFLYFVTSPPTVSGKVVVTGSIIVDGQDTKPPSGVVRAFDLVTGVLVWAFDPADPERNTPLAPGETYATGSPNMWTVASTDEELGLVYLPFGAATPDFFGAHRSPNADRFSNTLVAVDNATGRLRWTFQTIHHDIWDYDISSQPVITTIRHDGRDVKALVSIGKPGEAFVLDAATGKPLARVEERPVPQGAVPEERPSPTQPFSVEMPVFTGPEPAESRAWGLTPFDQLWCRIRFKGMRYHGRYTPPNTDTSLQFPGSAGGVNWGSVAIDESRRIMIVNHTVMPTHNRLITAAERSARGMKPIAPDSPGVSIETFFLGAPQWGTPYGGIVNLPFLSPLEVPCMQPPYGLISAVDLDAKKLLWSRPIGLADRLGPLGIPSRLPVTMGLPTLGGAVTTKSGLTFIASTPDRRLRAYETATGRMLWQTDLPANGNAMPMTYVARDGRQYVVIAAGGSGALVSNERNVLVAYALPRQR